MSSRAGSAVDRVTEEQTTGEGVLGGCGKGEARRWAWSWEGRGLERLRPPLDSLGAVLPSVQKLKPLIKWEPKSTSL